jgi:hypothetical protein
MSRARSGELAGCRREQGALRPAGSAIRLRRKEGDHFSPKGGWASDSGEAPFFFGDRTFVKAKPLTRWAPPSLDFGATAIPEGASPPPFAPPPRGVLLAKQGKA